MNEVDRRKFLVGSSAALGLGGYAMADEKAKSPVKLKKGGVVLFQGDSITDAGRDKKGQKPNQPRGLGNGYPLHIAGGLLSDHGELGLTIHNRGISGNKVPDLEKRWQKDALDLKPDVLSILIGVNDIWHKLNGRYDGTPEVYRDGFAKLLADTRAALPETTFVICEPFVLRCGAVKDNWFPEFETRRAFAEEVAKEAGAIWVPFQQRFNEAVEAGTEPAYWAGDGVHPSLAGHALMAKTWRESVGI